MQRLEDAAETASNSNKASEKETKKKNNNIINDLLIIPKAIFQLDSLLQKTPLSLQSVTSILTFIASILNKVTNYFRRR